MPIPLSTTLLAAAAILAAALSGVAQVVVVSVLVGLAVLNECIRAVVTRPAPITNAGVYEIPAQPVQPRVRTPIGSDGG